MSRTILALSTGGVGGAAIGNSMTNHRHYHRGYAYHPYHHHYESILTNRRRPVRGRDRGPRYAGSEPSMKPAWRSARG
jgi:hypothetical protein